MFCIVKVEAPKKGTRAHWREWAMDITFREELRKAKVSDAWVVCLPSILCRYVQNLPSHHRMQNMLFLCASRFGCCEFATTWENRTIDSDYRSQCGFANHNNAHGYGDSLYCVWDSQCRIHMHSCRDNDYHNMFEGYAASAAQIASRLVLLFVESIRESRKPERMVDLRESM